jgi:hypothetical protein
MDLEQHERIRAQYAKLHLSPYFSGKIDRTPDKPRITKPTEFGETINWEVTPEDDHCSKITNILKYAAEETKTEKDEEKRHAMMGKIIEKDLKEAMFFIPFIILSQLIREYPFDEEPTPQQMDKILIILNGILKSPEDLLKYLKECIHYDKMLDLAKTEEPKRMEFRKNGLSLNKKHKYNNVLTAFIDKNPDTDFSNLFYTTGYSTDSPGGHMIRFIIYYNFFNSDGKLEQDFFKKLNITNNILLNKKGAIFPKEEELFIANYTNTYYTQILSAIDTYKCEMENENIITEADNVKFGIETFFNYPPTDVYSSHMYIADAVDSVDSVDKKGKPIKECSVQKIKDSVIGRKMDILAKKIVDHFNETNPTTAEEPAMVTSNDPVENVEENVITESVDSEGGKRRRRRRVHFKTKRQTKNKTRRLTKNKNKKRKTKNKNKRRSHKKIDYK